MSEHWLADHFAQHALRWARACGAPASSLALVRAAAYRVSLATAAGHVCTHLPEISRDHGDDTTALRARLLASGVVGTPDSPGAMPLILDADGRVYLHRYFDYERRLAARLLSPSAMPPDANADAQIAARLAKLFGADAQPSRGTDWRKIAVALAVTGNLTIISGGPGTGKTTTVVKLLACLLAQDSGCRVALAAPTGKAAARMLETVRARARQLPPELQARMPQESFTVHRLLGATSVAGTFRHTADHPLPIDVLIVDEASMLDLALAAKLVDAVPDSARIILLGDKDQLAAVESGAIFSELSADPTLDAGCIARIAALTSIPASHIVPAPPAQPTALRDHVVWLTENFRFAKDSGIGRLATDINAGEAKRALAWMRSSEEPAVSWLEDTAATPAADTLSTVARGYSAYADAVLANPADRAAVFAAYERFRVLCAEREGPRGVAGMNDAIGRWFRQSAGGPRERPDDGGPSSTWYPGRPVVVLRNDYVLKLFNGDVGIVLPDDAGEPKVFFPDGEAGYRAVAPLRLPEHETAFAMTVHKAQGSEFDEILLLLPAEVSRVVTRELLYTAVTRARARVAIAGGADVLEAGIASPTRRHSGLIARLQERAAT